MADAVQQRLASALADRQFHQIAPILDLVELESANPSVLLDWPHALHLLGHIYNQNLEDARFLWKRIPGEAKQNNAELEAVWRLLQYFWNRQYQGIWQALEAHQWSNQVRPLVEALADATRQRMLALLGHAYALVTPAKAASLLGLSREEALSMVQAAGWQLEGDGVLKTKRVAPPEADRDSRQVLAQLSEYIGQLEA